MTFYVSHTKTASASQTALLLTPRTDERQNRNRIAVSDKIKQATSTGCHE